MPDASDLSRKLLAGGNSVVADRMAGALRAAGQTAPNPCCQVDLVRSQEVGAAETEELTALSMRGAMPGHGHTEATGGGHLWERGLAQTLRYSAYTRPKANALRDATPSSPSTCSIKRNRGLSSM